MLSGEFDVALEQYLDALKASKTVQDSATVYYALIDFYLSQGQTQKSLEAFKQMAEKYKRILPPKDYLVFRVFYIEPYIIAGEIDEALALLDDLSLMLEAPLDNIVPFGYLHVYLATGAYDKAREAISGAENLIADFGEEMLMAEIFYAQGKMSEKDGKYAEAIEFYNKCHEINSLTYVLNDDIARCYRLQKDYKNAEKTVQTSLKRKPFNPSGNYEAALLYFDMGKEEKGLEYLQRAVDIWKDADPDYEKANDAKEKLNSLKSL
jgi:pentatricopeptide repeat protein